MSQNNITTDNTKKRNASTVKHSPACFQHRLSQSNITTNLTNVEPGVESARQRSRRASQPTALRPEKGSSRKPLKRRSPPINTLRHTIKGQGSALSFRTPLYPFLSIAGIVGLMALLIGMPNEALMIDVVMILSLIVIYYTLIEAES